MRSPNPGPGSQQALSHCLPNLNLHLDDALWVRSDPKPVQGARCLSSRALPQRRLPVPVDSLHFQGQEPDAIITA